MIPMILSLLLISLSFTWLLAETKFLTIQLQAGKTPEPDIETPKRKQRPIIEPCTFTQVKTCSYPVVLLLPEFCGFTIFQQNKDLMRYGRYRHYSYNGVDPINHNSYQETIIGGHKVTLNATSPKLYDTIAELQKVADSKSRKFIAKSPPLPLFVETVRTGSHNEYIPRKIWHEDGTTTDDPKHGFNQIVSEYKTYYKDCLCGKEWLEAHINDVIPEPTIDLIVDGIETHFNGNFKTGCIKELIKIKRGK